MAKLTLNDVTAVQNQTSLAASINTNSTLIEDALENTLSRDGTSPNSMSADIDMGGNRIINLPTATSDTEPVTRGQIASLETSVSQIDSSVATCIASASAASTSASAAAASAAAAALFDPSTYFTKSEVTTFLAGKASAGSNTNITSLGGLTTALSVAQGGTGATTAPAARTSLGLGSAATLNVGTSANNVVQVGADGKIPSAVYNGAPLNTQAFTTSGTWTKPTVGASAIAIITLSGGGGGGGGGGNGYSGGGGGGGGGLTWIGFASQLPSSATVTVGAGGAAGTATTASGAGGTTTFGSLFTSTGGSPGGQQTSVSVAGGGPGGVGTSTLVGAIASQGGSSTAKVSGNVGISGGMGGGAGAAGAAGNSSVGGAGGVGGGGGGGGSNSANYVGGAGGAGFCSVTLIG